jgi:hypothetical protein
VQAAQRGGEDVACYREYRSKDGAGGCGQMTGWDLVKIHLGRVEKFTSLFLFGSVA